MTVVAVFEEEHMACLDQQHSGKEGQAAVVDASSIGACRPRIFFINGFLCFLGDEWQRNGEGRERGDTTSRRR